MSKLSKQNLIIYKLPVLYNILNEIRENFKFNLYNFSEKYDFKKIDSEKFGNYIILTNYKNKIKNKSNQLIFENFPTSIFKIIEKANILFLKQKFQDQSQISIGKYRLDLNSRKLLNKEKSLKLTERETEIIIFLNNSKESQSIENLQNKVWGHVTDLETHTVETHIYRLRKKLMETFDGDKFIISTKEGYKI
jgi:DNA-binding response OmpR family regulator